MPNNLEKYADAVYKCIRCGACHAVCPTYGEELNETSVARGRMALVEAVINGELDLTAGFEKAMFHCAMCGACKAGCPSGVDVPAIIEAARAELVAKKRSEPIARFLARKSLKDKAAMDRAFALMALGRAAYGPLAATPLAKYLPYQYKDFKRNFPKIPSKPLSARVPALSGAKGSKGKVAFFVGCVVNYVYPEIGEAAIKVINAAGYDVLMVKEELCCGKPLKSLGEVDAFKSLAEKTVKLFGGLEVEAVLTACPTCALTLKEDYPKILPDSKAAAAFAGKVKDVNHFLVTHSDLISQLGMAELKVTYHDPCHLNFGLNVRSEPRQLVDAATCGGLVEMPEATRCCGFGGSFSFLDYGLSGRISHRKAENIISTGAAAVATACPGCMMHIRDALKQSGSDIATLHTVQVIEKALK
jgi:glycolate oxidase iron-sulfur subunit